jgi:GT2 family glycosyltransferase
VRYASSRQILPELSSGGLPASARQPLTLRAHTVLRRVLAWAEANRRRHPWAAEHARRAVLVVWWSFTFQLHTQLRLWLRARRLRGVAVRPVPAQVIAELDPRRIAVPCAERPLVSVIIPMHGKSGYTLTCLASIAANAPDAPIEVIVVDDASPAEDIEVVTQVRGIRLLRLPHKKGFLETCNFAAQSAWGDFLLFLNNDTQVQPGWLDSMLRLFYTRLDAGAVGSKLLYPDGRLQEAGGIIWDDGSGWNFGRHEDETRPAYNYVREVDYCSGASLMVRRAVFERLGGFDSVFAPAYFEDADLCFRLRAAGLKTLYQPRSRVVHFEGVSHGRDVAAGVKSYQAVNRKAFVGRWRSVLAEGHYANGTRVLRACERGRSRKLILVVDHWVPQPDQDAGSRTMLCLLSALLESGLIVKFWPHNQAATQPYTEALQEMGVEVIHGGGPASFIEWVREHGRELDYALLSRPDIAEELVPLLRQHSDARVIYYGQDLHFRRMRLQSAALGDQDLLTAAAQMEQRERAVWRRVDAALYPSEEEAGMAAELEPSAMLRPVQPYGFRCFAEARRAPRGREILFVAGFAHPPNEDAAVWLVESVLPLIRSCVPDAVLSIIGSNPTARVLGLQGDGVTVAANLSEAALERRYQAARVAAVPLRCGAGVKLKVVEALKEGLPLVTTSIGAQGLPGLGMVASIRDDREAFATAVGELLVDDLVWEERCLVQIDYARKRFGMAQMRESLLAAAGIEAVVGHCKMR